MADRFIEYQDGETILEGYLKFDDTRPRPGILICHAWAGRSEFECGRAAALADLGYAGFAMDLYGKGILGTSPDENTRLMQPFLEDRAGLQARLELALGVLCDQPEVDAGRVAAIGYCFGGLCALDLARSGAAVRGVVSFHGLFNPPANAAGGKIDAKILALTGREDPMVPPEAVEALAQELTGADADWQIHIFSGAMHGFTNPQADMPDMGIQYNAAAEHRSWTYMQNFLQEILA